MGLLDAVAAELPVLLAGDELAFMSKVNQALVPPRPKPKPTEATEEPEGPTD